MHTELQSFVIVFVCTGSTHSFKFLLVTRNSCWVARVASILEKYEAIYILFCLGKWVSGQWTYMVWRSLLCKVVSNKKFMTLAIGIFHLGAWSCEWFYKSVQSFSFLQIPRCLKVSAIFAIRDRDATQLSNLWWMPKSVSKVLGAAQSMSS